MSGKRRLLGSIRHIRRLVLQGGRDGFVDPLQPNELEPCPRILGDVVEVAPIAGRQHHPREPRPRGRATFSLIPPTGRTARAG